MRLPIPLAFLYLSGICLPALAADNEKNPIFEEERNAYMIFEGWRPASVPDTLQSYTRKLSPGGKVYFFANRREYTKALELLNTQPNQHSGSALYVRAFCLDGQGKSAEAIKVFEKAKSKIGIGFKPGPKFFLQLSTAQYHVGDYWGSLKNIEIAERMHATLGLHDDNEQGSVSWTALRRKACIKEKQRKFEEAFDQYLSFFGPAESQFHLDEALKADPKIAARAKKWLAERPSAPATKDLAILAKYLLTKGKAYIALGDFAKAKLELEKLVSINAGKILDPDSFGARTPSSNSSEVRNNSLVSSNPLTKTKDEARVLLIRMYYPEKNFEKCCTLIRGTFFADPMDSFAHYFSGLTMSDVPELVTKNDISLHDKNLEVRLDFGAYKVRLFEPDLKLMKDRISMFMNDPLLKTACDLAQKKLYNESYLTLDRYMVKYETADNSSMEDAQAMLFFRMHQYYKCALIQKGLALALHRRDFVLPFRNDKRTASSVWVSVESYLLGNPVPPTSAQKSLTDKMPSFIYWCHFAAGVNGMYKRDFKLAAKEFAQAGNQKSDDPVLRSFSKVLENFCVSAK